MKLLNVYKQGDVNWFGYKCIISYSHRLYAHLATDESELKSWIKKSSLGIAKRKPNEDK